jgi:hypothetical protein
MKTWINGKIVDLSAEEIAVIEAERKEWNDAKPTRQLAEIKKIRLQKLSETDYMALNDYTMPDHIKTWRQSLRDIPANNDSSKYDDLLKRDDKGNLTHAIWTQPTE